MVAAISTFARGQAPETEPIVTMSCKFKPKLRDAIAREAARLLLRGTDTDYHAARQHAARWLSRRKVASENLPSDKEIEAQIYALARIDPPQRARGSCPNGSRRTDSPNPIAHKCDVIPCETDGYDTDTLAVFYMLLQRLEQVQQDPEFHPEGDALYHCLQVFELGREQQSYDEEFLLACLLHDVGLGIDRRHPVEAALTTLQNLITERTLFLIEYRHPVTEYLLTGEIARSLRRSEHFDDLMLLARCDLDGRVPGADVPTVDEALEYIAGLDATWNR